MDKQKLTRRISALKGGRAELVIRNARVVNVFTDTLDTADVGVADGVVLGVGGEWQAEQEIDAAGAFLAPGLIDGHMHIESSMAHPARFADTVLRQGTTTVIADPHEIANVAGIVGIRYMLDQTEGLPLTVFFMLPSCVPATCFETSGASLSAVDLLTLAHEPRVLGLGEVMDYVAVTGADEAMLDKLLAFRDRPIDGHAPLLSGRALQAYCLAGPFSDHECSNFDEVKEKLAQGMHIQLRYGSACRGVEEIMSRVAKEGLPTERMLFCTDDKHLENIRAEGHINFILRRAVANGIPAVTALKMATLNAAGCYGLRDRGAVAPGFRADLVLFRDLKDFDMENVICGGRLFTGVQEQAAPPAPAEIARSVHLAPRRPDCLRLPVGQTMPILQLVPGEVLTTLDRRPVPQQDGCFKAGEGLVKIAVLERHHASGRIGLGVLEGLPIRGGAIATTVGHDSHNLVAAGDNDGDMLAAVDVLEECGGGYTVVSGGKTLALLPLPIAGLMSDAPLSEIFSRQQALLRAARQLGLDTDSADPFITLSFVALPVLPACRITDKGMFDVTSMSFIK